MGGLGRPSRYVGLLSILWEGDRQRGKKAVGFTGTRGEACKKNGGVFLLKSQGFSGKMGFSWVYGQKSGFW